MRGEKGVRGKGVRNLLCEAPERPFRQKVPDTFSPECEARMSHKLTLRMAAPSIVISLLLFASGSLGAWYVLNLQKSTAATVQLDMATIHAVERLVLSVTEVRSELSDFLATGDRAHLEAMPIKFAEMERCLRATEALVDDDDEIALARRIRAGYARVLNAFQQISVSPAQAGVRRAVEQLNNDLARRGVLAPAAELLVLEENLNRQSGDNNQRRAAEMAVFLWVFGAFGAAAGVVAGFGIARSVTRSIVELYVPVRAASGRLEEVVGPVDLVPSAGIENLDVILHTHGRPDRHGRRPLAAEPGRGAARRADGRPGATRCRPGP